MTKNPLEPGLDRLLEAIPKILHSASVEASITEALDLLRYRSGAEAAAMFLADGDAPLREHWSPDEASVKKALRPRFKVEALEAIRRGGAHLTLGQGPPKDGRVTETVLLSSDSGPFGAVALAWSAPSVPDDPTTLAWIHAAVEMVASLLIAQSEISKLRAQAVRDKRWFKTLDDHLRVLDRERQKFAAVVNQTDTFVFVTDEERKISWNNRAMAVLLPFDSQGSSSSWVGKTCADVCARLGHGSTGSEACECPIRRALEQNEVTHQEIRVSVRGTPGFLYLTALPIKGLDGKPREAMILVQDLTSLETLRHSGQAELELGESQARQGAMVEAALDAIISMDHAGRILEFNPAAEQIFGRKREDVLGRDMATLIIPPELRDRHRLGMEHYLATGESRLMGRRIEMTAMRADGTRFPVELAIARISSKGPPVFTGFIRDLSARKSTEDALRSAEDRLRTVVVESPLVVFALDRNGIFTLSSGKGLERLGLREGEAVGMSVYDLYRDHPNVLANVDRCLAGEEFSAEVDIGTLAFETHYTPVRSTNGEVVGLFGVATDITERKTLEVQLRHAQKMEAVGRLAGGVAHDFNNLLTVINGHSEVLLGRMAPGDPFRKSVEEVQKAGARGILLTRQLLAFSRKDVSTPEVLDLGEVVRGMESMLGRLIGADIELITRTGSWPLSILADRGQIEQVLANLAVNARDAMAKGGELVIEVSATEVKAGDASYDTDLAPGPYVALTVSDQGSGMGAEVLSHLFEPFFTTKEQGKGTGLGLSVVYGIVRQAGGGIHVESEPGRGSTFRILLPRVGGLEPPVSGKGAAGVVAAEAGSDCSILLVEDESAVRELARDMLHVLGYQVVEAASGDEALAVFERHRGSIRLVISDIVMPGMGGIELARRLVVQESRLKVLLVSGYAKDTLDDEEFRKEGFVFLQKPYTLEDFGRKVADLLRASASRPSAR